MMNKDRKFLLIVLTAVLIIFCFSGCKQNDGISSNTNGSSVISEDYAENNPETVDDAEKASEESSSEEAGTAVIENEGDIEIVIPDDQEFGGE